MIDINTIIIFVGTIVIVNTFIIGYLFGLSSSRNGVSTDRPKSFFKQQNSTTKENNSISIDDKTFVTDIKTEGLEKKYDSLGEVKKTQDNISNSVNKLKNLKR